MVFGKKKKEEDKIITIKPSGVFHNDFIKLNLKIDFPRRFCLISHLGEIKNQGVESSALYVSADFMQCLYKKSFKPSFKYSSTDLDYYSPRSICRVLFKRGLLPDEKFNSFEILINRCKNKTFQRILMNNFTKETKDYTILKYFKLNSINDIKDTLYKLKSIIIACFPIYNYSESFFKPQKETDKVLGYHIVSIVGWDDEEKYLLIRNSWGVEWGIKGYSKYFYEDFGLHESLFSGTR
jgi:hypothetical protein